MLWEYTNEPSDIAASLFPTLPVSNTDDGCGSLLLLFMASPLHLLGQQAPLLYLLGTWDSGMSLLQPLNHTCLSEAQKLFPWKNGQHGRRSPVAGFLWGISKHFLCLWCHLLTKSWEHSWQNAFSFHIQDRNMLVDIYKSMTAVSLDCIILITTEKSSLPEHTLFMIFACATQLYNCVIIGQALHRFSNM